MIENATHYEPSKKISEKKQKKQNMTFSFGY